MIDQCSYTRTEFLEIEKVHNVGFKNRWKMNTTGFGFFLIKYCHM